MRSSLVGRGGGRGAKPPKPMPPSKPPYHNKREVCAFCLYPQSGQKHCHRLSETCNGKSTASGSQQPDEPAPPMESKRRTLATLCGATGGENEKSADFASLRHDTLLSLLVCCSWWMFSHDANHDGTYYVPSLTSDVPSWISLKIIQKLPCPLS